MRNRFLILTFILIAAFGVGYEMRPPSAWNEVQVGMTREQVYTLVGQPNYSMGSIKGDFFTKRGVLVETTMNVYFDGDRASSVMTDQRIGTAKHFYRSVLRAESAPN